MSTVRSKRRSYCTKRNMLAVPSDPSARPVGSRWTSADDSPNCLNASVWSRPPFCGSLTEKEELLDEFNQICGQVLTGIGWGSLRCAPRCSNTSGTKSGMSYGYAEMKAQSPNTPVWRTLTASQDSSNNLKKQIYPY